MSTYQYNGKLEATFNESGSEAKISVTEELHINDSHEAADLPDPNTKRSFMWAHALLELLTEHKRPMLMLVAFFTLTTGGTSVFLTLKFAPVEVKTEYITRTIIKKVPVTQTLVLRKRLGYRLLEKINFSERIGDEATPCKQRLAALRLMMGEESFLEVVGEGNCGKHRKLKRRLRWAYRKIALLKRSRSHKKPRKKTAPCTPHQSRKKW